MSSYHPLSSRASVSVWSCPWFSVRKDTVVLPNGTETTYWYAVKPDSVFVVPVTREGEIVLIRSYRHPMHDWFWEIPAGHQKPGQSPEEAACAELREETGGVAKTWESLGRFCPNGGFLQSFTHVFLAMGVVLGKSAHEPEEQIEVHPVPIARALEMARDGTIASSQSAHALFLCEKYLKDAGRGIC